MNKLYRMKYTNRYWDEELPLHWKVLRLFGLVKEVDAIECELFDASAEEIII